MTIAMTQRIGLAGGKFAAPHNLCPFTVSRFTKHPCLGLFHGRCETVKWFTTSSETAVKSVKRADFHREPVNARETVTQTAPARLSIFFNHLSVCPTLR